MANDEPKTPGFFDVGTIKSLVRLMSLHDLSEIDLQQGDVRLRLRRGRWKDSEVVTLPAQPAPIPAAPVTAPAPLPRPAAAEAAPPQKAYLEIKSPTPGTFYASPSPDAEPYVRVGSRVTPTTVVCLIEAMKIFNEIPADCTGVIAEILVQNQQAVEYGQVLFRIDPTA